MFLMPGSRARNPRKRKPTIRDHDLAAANIARGVVAAILDVHTPADYDLVADNVAAAELAARVTLDIDLVADNEVSATATGNVTVSVPAAAPAFVNIGADTGLSFGTTLTPALPASRVNGNLLIASFFTSGFKSGGFNITVSAGWTILDFHKSSDGSSCIAYRYVDGSETACTFTMDGSQSARGRCAQYSGTLGPGAFHHTRNATSSVNMGDAGITTTADNSLIVAILGGYAGTTTISNPPGYTVDAPAAGGTGGTTLWASQVQAVTGTPSDPVSATAGNASFSWTVYSIELLAGTP